MKSKISKLLGVALTVALLASLMAMAAPVSARPLGWSTETIPSDANSVIATIDVVDIAVAEDGTTIFAGDGVANLYKSVDRGKTWATIALDNADNGTDLVAVAPDDVDMIAYCDVSVPEVYVSTNGGSNWGSLNVETQVTLDAANVTDMDISAAYAGVNYLSICGQNSDAGEVWTYNIGAAAPAWVKISGKPGYDATSTNSTAAALAYSPNFPSDLCLIVVAEEDDGTSSGTDEITLNIYSESSDQWNTDAGFNSYPAAIATDDDITGITAASITLDPEYLGSDDAMRLSFIGLTVQGGSAEDTGKSGIYRMNDVLEKDLKVGTTADINSVAYDGATLVAGEYSSNVCYYCTDPTSTTPTIDTTRSYKRPGIDVDGQNEMVIVAWAGGDVVAGTSNKGAFSVSYNDGLSFNDISLIDNALTNLADVMPTPDGSKAYLLADDNTDISLWRYDGSWERVLAITDGDDYILRVAPDDGDVVYVAEKGSGKRIYYSADGGEERWQIRTCGVEITDMAVEGDGGVAYALTSGGRVSKSTNSGFHWAPSVSTKLTSGHMIASVSEDSLLVGDNTGLVSYSTDGNATWTKIVKLIGDTASPVQAIATGLADNDFIYAALENSGVGVYRWQIGVSSAAWTTIKSAESTDNYTCYGIDMQDGALYAQTWDGTTSTTLRTLGPSADPTAYVTWSEMTSSGNFTAAPQSIRVTGGGSGKLWAISSTGISSSLYSYTDTLLGVSPTVLSPADGYIVNVNPVTGYAQDIILSWEKPADYVEDYDVWIALDTAFAERVKIIGSASPSPTPSQPVGKDVTGAEFSFMPGETYYWKVRVSADGPILSGWSEVRSITVAETVVTPPVQVTTQPAPEITVTIPDVIVNIPPTVEVPAATPITPGWIYAIIAVGAILVIAVIILIVRTRRAV